MPFTGFKQESFTSSDNLATNVAALTATSGVDISGGRGVSCTLDGGSGHTITGGALRCYVYVPVTANKDGTAATFAWTAYNTLDETTLTNTVAERYHTLGDKQPLTGVGRICWLPDAVTLSAGTSLVICYATRRSRDA